MFLIIWRVIKKNLHPLISLSSVVDNRSANDLDMIESKTLPKEIAPLHQAINRLFKRIRYSFEREREFTDHAAHELRTPLAAMKTQAQVLLKVSSDQGAYREGLENLLASIDRSTHLTNQLLLLARLQNNQYPNQKVDISLCLHDVIDMMTATINSKGIRLSTNIVKSLFVLGHSESLLIMLKNIIENAVKYTPRKGVIAINLFDNGMLQVIDSGAGIENKEHDKVFNRFYRISGSGESGSGLGLSIVKWIAEAHDIKINLSENTPTGLIVSINFTV
jgi:signal transduction histidine kinase